MEHESGKDRPIDLTATEEFYLVQIVLKNPAAKELKLKSLSKHCYTYLATFNPLY